MSEDFYFSLLGLAAGFGIGNMIQAVWGWPACREWRERRKHYHD